MIDVNKFRNEAETIFNTIVKPQINKAKEMSQEKTLTLGERRVALNFNPAENPVVAGFKRRYADIIDDLESLRGVDPENQERQRTISRAQTLAEDACMLSVKQMFQ